MNVCILNEYTVFPVDPGSVFDDDSTMFGKWPSLVYVRVSTNLLVTLSYHFYSRCSSRNKAARWAEAGSEKWGQIPRLITNSLPLGGTLA